MKPANRRLGSLEIQFFSWAHKQGLRICRSGQAASALRLTAKQERELMSRLARNGFILRLQRGIYLVPSHLPGSGAQRWDPSVYTIVHCLTKTLDAQYQIGGPLAFQFHGLLTAVPRIIHVYNTHISGQRTIGSHHFQWIRVHPKRLGGASEFSLEDQSVLRISNLARTLMDAVYDYHRFDSLPRAYQWILAQRENRGLLNELATMSLRFGNQGTLRRIGHLLERLGTPADVLNGLQQALTSRKSLIPMVPNAEATGPVDTRWGIIHNAPELPVR